LPLRDLTDTPLSMFQIDVGQGDGAVVQLPDGRWLMVDGGLPGRFSSSGRIAADLLDWKSEKLGGRSGGCAKRRCGLAS
jgi:hypothetical protein